MKLVPVNGCELCLTQKEKDALHAVHDLLRTMYEKMNDNDICLLITAMQTAPYSDLSDNKLFINFSCEETEECTDFIREMAEFLFALADATAAEENR